jgi:hypothetical protein
MNKSRTTKKQLVTQNALAIAAAYALTTIHHIYGGLVDKAPNRLRVPVIMAVPTLATVAALHRYERTGSKIALVTSATVTSVAWVALSGLLHGGYAHAYKDILFLTGSPAKPGSTAAPCSVGSAVIMKRALELGEWRLRASHASPLGGHLFDAIVAHPKRPRRRLR